MRRRDERRTMTDAIPSGGSITVAELIEALAQRRANLAVGAARTRGARLRARSAGPTAGTPRRGRVAHRRAALRLDRGCARCEPGLPRRARRVRHRPEG